ncbi:MAG: rod shape-determining protein MreD [Defluviitaleaceae bacterium]|nr:rod shape-determining protein MreD [Defluviitaleaceae bacterium]
MLRIFLLAMLLLANFIAQTTLWPELAILGVVPDTAVILIVSYGMLRGEIEGAIFGLAVGLVADIFTGVHVGTYALMGFVMGYVSGKPFKDYFKDNFFLPFFVVMVMMVLSQLLAYMVHIVFVGRLEFWFFVHAVALPTMVYTAALAIPLYSFLHYCNNKVEAYEEKRRAFFENK